MFNIDKIFKGYSDETFYITLSDSNEVIKVFFDRQGVWINLIDYDAAHLITELNESDNNYNEISYLIQILNNLADQQFKKDLSFFHLKNQN